MHIKSLLFICFVFSLSTLLYSQEKTLFFIGDTGKDTIPSEALYLLEFEAKQIRNSTVVFLGDNVYPSGNAKNDMANSAASRILLNQLNLFDEIDGQLYITSGNHDWANGKPRGYSNLQAQEALVKEWRNQHINIQNPLVYYPANGNPGPDIVDVYDNVQLIFLHSQAFLQQSLPSEVRKMRADAFGQIDSMLAQAALLKKYVIIAAHHPVLSNGKHAATLQPWRFLIQYTPLQIFGLAGLNQVIKQNIRHPRYKRYAKQLMQTISKYENVVYITGHDHNMQHFIHDLNHYIISGSGSKMERVSFYFHQARMMEDRKLGYIRLSINEEGELRLAAHSVQSRGEFASYLLCNEPVKLKSSTHSQPDSTQSFE